MPIMLAAYSGALCPVEGAESGVDLARSALKMNASLEANLLNVTQTVSFRSRSNQHRKTNSLRYD